MIEASWNEYKLTFNALSVSCRNTHNISMSTELAKTSINNIIMSILI